MFASLFDDPCLSWVKSTHSSGNNNDCVEFARAGHYIGVRDSKNPEGQKLAFPIDQMRRSLANIKARPTGR